ncbi:hypothetical protein LguiA_020396 [Lonicera macranthoides]
MDTLLLFQCPSMAKRPCCSSPPDLNSPTLNPNPRIFKRDQIDMDSLLESFLSLSDSSSPSLDLSFDRLIESRASDSDQHDMIERALRLGSVLLEAGKRSARKRASLQNGVLWPLPPDLTIKFDEVAEHAFLVFSMLDTQSVCYAAATCSLFHKCASDPLCYANIDLTTEVPKVNNVVVSAMIQRAGKVLQSLKLGIVPGPTASPGSCQPLPYSIRNPADASGFSWNDKRSRQGKESSILSRSCLSSLGGAGGAPGTLLRRLHLYNIERMDNAAFSSALSTCPSLLDLEIVGLHVELRQTLESVSKHCHLIERLFFESSKTGRDDSLKLPTCSDLVNNCPHLTSLALRGFKLHDYKARVLVKVFDDELWHDFDGFRKLKYVDFSTSYSITGVFLKVYPFHHHRNLGGSAGGNLLEVLILRDCMHLKEDISNREGLASEGDWYRRCFSPSFIPVEQLFGNRPDFCLLAEFPPEGSYNDGSDGNSDFSMPSELSSRTSDGSTFVNSSESSSYNSDQGSGNEDTRDTSSLLYEESSDEVEENRMLLWCSSWKEMWRIKQSIEKGHHMLTPSRFCLPTPDACGLPGSLDVIFSI